MLFAGLALLSPSARAATNPAPQGARFLHLTVEDGLSQNTVRSILQDSRGFLWFATEEGLNRYDGYSFVPFKHRPKDETSLPSDLVTALYEDRSGRFWVGTRGALSLYDPQTETFVTRLQIKEEIMALVQDRQGRLWVGTAGEGLFCLDGEGRRPPRHYLAGDDPDSLTHDKVYALLEDRSGRLWVATHGGGLDLLKPDESGFVHHRHDPRNPASLSFNELWSLAEDRTGKIWVGTNTQGVSVLDPARGTFRHYRASSDPGALRGGLVATLHVDRHGTLWLGGDGGLHRYDAESDQFVPYVHDPRNPQSISWNVVRSIYEDAQGNLWVATFASGLNFLRRNTHPFQLHTHRPDSTNLTAVKSFLEDRDGSVWIGTAKGELNRFDPAKGTFRVHKVDSDTVLDIHQDHRGRMWAGTWGGGLFRVDPATGAVTAQRLAAVTSVRDERQVWAVTDDESGRLWLGTDGGLFLFDPDTGAVTRFEADDKDPAKLNHPRVRDFHYDDNGDLWIATLGGGINVLSPDRSTFRRYQNDPDDPKSLSNDMVMTFHKDRRGRLWVGTFNGGLNLFDPADRSFRTFREKDGLPSNSVYAILDDEQGRLWLSTNNGLCRFNPDSKQVEKFDASNGLDSLQFNLDAAVHTRAGPMLFGTWNGFYLFDPTRILPNPRVPPIVLTSLEVLNEPRKTDVALPHAREIRLHHDDKLIGFQFAVLEYNFPRRNLYAYKLEGLDDAWTEIGAKREITFTKLDPGRYVLRVKGTNSDGVWDQEGTSLHIVIPPPYWMTWWFRTACIFTFLGAIFSAHRYRVGLHEARERELELRIEEALSKLKIMKGLLPICATCKKVRDDKGYWNQIESYIRSHSEADFSHGICPDCIVKYWGKTRAAAAAKKRES